MKKLMLGLLTAILLVSCSKKDSDITPKKQIVTYKLKCRDCLAIIETEKWNKRNELDRSKTQTFNVNGEWSYSFENLTLDSIDARVYVGVFGPEQTVEFSMHESKYNRRVDFNGKLGFSNYWPFKESELEKSFTLQLK